MGFQRRTDCQSIMLSTKVRLFESGLNLTKVEAKLEFLSPGEHNPIFLKGIDKLLQVNRISGSKCPQPFSKLLQSNLVH